MCVFRKMLLYVREVGNAEEKMATGRLIDIVDL